MGPGGNAGMAALDLTVQRYAHTAVWENGWRFLERIREGYSLLSSH